MKTLTLTAAVLCALGTFAFAGTSTYSGKESQVQQTTCPQWYGDREWNVGLWGAYAFSSNNGDDNINDFTFRNNGVIRSHDVLGDSAFGGGIDVKYFFARYFGIGLEGFGLAGDNEDNAELNRFLVNNGYRRINDDATDGAAAALATFTLRYPIPCSRLAPYVWGGVGGLFGGGDRIVYNASRDRFQRENRDDGSLVGQFGGGLEVRLTPHIGLMTDVSWNISEQTDFGMVRAGVNFAF